MSEMLRIHAKRSGEKKDNMLSQKKSNVNHFTNSPVDRILYLQRTVGNQAVSRLMRSGALQAKLRIGQPGDVYEQEADRVADAVMRMPEPGVQREVEPEEEEEILQTKPLVDQITPVVQRQVEEEEEEEMLQAKNGEDSTSEVTNDLESQINAIKGGGQPLGESERTFFEPRFGADFGNVSVHSDARAAHVAGSVNARAFTLGRDVVFGAGQYSPGTSSGRKLLAHELTHTLQQRNESTMKRLVGRNIGNIAVLNTSQQIQKDALALGGLGVAVFDQVSGLAPYGSGGLKWEGNIGKAFHKWPAGQKPAQNYWKIDRTADLLDLSCISFPSIASGMWHLRWNYNGADIDQAYVYKSFSLNWAGGLIGSTANITFKMEDASGSYESGGRAAMICYIKGSLDPSGVGDIDYRARVLIYADGKTKRLGDFEITRGERSDFTIRSWGAGWSVTNE